MNKINPISDIVSADESDGAVERDLPEMHGTSDQGWGFVLLAKRMEYLWEECAWAETVEELLDQMSNIIDEWNEDQAEGEGENNRWSVADFAIVNQRLAREYARKAESFIDAFREYLPEQEEDGHYGGLAELWEVVSKTPEVVTSTPSIHGAIAMLQKCGMPAVLMLDECGCE